MSDGRSWLRTSDSNECYEALNSPLAPLPPSRNVLLYCSWRGVRQRRCPTRNPGSCCHTRQPSSLLDYRALGARGCTAAPPSFGIRLRVVRLLRLVGAGSYLPPLEPWLARFHPPRLVHLALSCSRCRWASPLLAELSRRGRQRSCLSRNDAIGSGERTRPACCRRRPDVGLAFPLITHRLVLQSGRGKFAAGRRKPHAGGMCSPPLTAWKRLSIAGVTDTGNLPESGARWVDRGGEDRLTGRHEIIRSSGGPGIGGSRRIHGKRGRLALLARAGHERHFDREGLANKVAGGGAEAALEGVRWHWVLFLLGQRRAGLYDGQ